MNIDDEFQNMRWPTCHKTIISSIPMCYAKCQIVNDLYLEPTYINMPTLNFRLGYLVFIDILQLHVT